MYSIEILNQQSFAFVNIIPMILIAAGLGVLQYVVLTILEKNKKWYICQIAGNELHTQTENPLLFDEKEKALEWANEQVGKGLESGYSANELKYINDEHIVCFVMMTKELGSGYTINVYETENRSHD